MHTYLLKRLLLIFPTLFGVAVVPFLLIRIIPGDVVELRYSGDRGAVPWLPPMVYTPFWVSPWQNLAQLIWPALAVGYRYSAVATRMTRSAMLEVLREDYIRTARAKGLMQKLVLSRHALKNAMLPVLTVVAIEFAFLIGGLVVTEQVFNLNGIGLLFVQAVAHRDYTLLQALVMLVAFVFILVNFTVDLAYAWIHPRIRYR